MADDGRDLVDDACAVAWRSLVCAVAEAGRGLVCACALEPGRVVLRGVRDGLLRAVVRSSD